MFTAYVLGVVCLVFLSPYWMARWVIQEEYDPEMLAPFLVIALLISIFWPITLPYWICSHVFGNVFKSFYKAGLKKAKLTHD